MSAPGFRKLSSRLLRLVNELVRRGEITERGLARLAGYSQPHIHNVLRGERGLNPGVADEILEALGIPLTALFTQDELSGRAPSAPPEASPVAVLAGALGGGRPFPRESHSGGRRYLPRRRLEGLIAPVCALLDREERSMWPLLWPNDAVLLDRSPAVRRRPAFENVYAIEWKGRGYVCRCQKVGQALVTVADNPEAAPELPTPLSLERRGVLDVVRGRIVWVGRDIDVAAAE